MGAVGVEFSLLEKTALFAHPRAQLGGGLAAAVGSIAIFSIDDVPRRDEAVPMLGLVFLEEEVFLVPWSSLKGRSCREQGGL